MSASGTTTLVLVTSDHGEQLGDHGLIGKSGFFEGSFHVPVPGSRSAPRRSRRPRGIDAFTENVDIFPTLAEAMGLEVPAQCDGVSLTALLHGERPDWWRGAAHWEFDWRTARQSPTAVASRLLGPAARAA